MGTEHTTLRRGSFQEGLAGHMPRLWREQRALLAAAPTCPPRAQLYPMEERRPGETGELTQPK